MLASVCWLVPSLTSASKISFRSRSWRLAGVVHALGLGAHDRLEARQLVRHGTGGAAVCGELQRFLGPRLPLVEHVGDGVRDRRGLLGELVLERGQAHGDGIARPDGANGLEPLGQPRHRSADVLDLVENDGRLCGDAVLARGPQLMLDIAHEVEHRLAIGRDFGRNGAHRALHILEAPEQLLGDRRLQRRHGVVRARQFGSPPLEVLGIVGAAQEQSRGRSLATVAQDGPHQVVHGGRHTVLPCASRGAAQDVLQLGGCARPAASGNGRRLGSDCGSCLAPQLAGAQPMLLQDFARSIDAREGVKEMLDADIAGGVKSGCVVGRVAAGKHRGVDGDRPVPSQLRQQGPACLRVGMFAAARRIRRTQLQIVALVRRASTPLEDQPQAPRHLGHHYSVKQ